VGGKNGPRGCLPHIKFLGISNQEIRKKVMRNKRGGGRERTYGAIPTKGKRLWGKKKEGLRKEDKLQIVNLLKKEERRSEEPHSQKTALKPQESVGDTITTRYLGTKD